MGEITGKMAVVIIIMALLLGWSIGQCKKDNKKTNERRMFAGDK